MKGSNSREYLKYNLHGIDIDDRAAQLAILGSTLKLKISLR